MGIVRKIIFVSLLSGIVFPALAHASPLKMFFFYPGGQGDQAAAQPLLDSFSEALKKVSSGKIEAEITYINDPEAVVPFIKSQKPQAAIIGLETYRKYGKAWGTEVIAKTLQLPSADGTDQYFLLGKSDATLPTSGKITILSPRLLDASFLKEKLFPELTGVTWEVVSTENPMGELRNIASGTKPGFLLLDQFEYANVSRLKIAWVAMIKALATSQKVSAAPVVVFSQNLPTDQVAILQDALLKIGQDAGAKTALIDLRMKGFKKAGNSDL